VLALQILSQHTNFDKFIHIYLDFTKAFDSVDQGFVNLALKAFGIGPRYREMIERLFINAHSRVIINGKRTVGYPILSGVRQGDPMAGFLFIIALELFAKTIRASRHIKGCSIGEHTKTLNLHCDDIAIFLKDKNSYHRTMAILNALQEASGLKYNTGF